MHTCGGLQRPEIVVNEESLREFRQRAAAQLYENEWPTLATSYGVLEPTPQTDGWDQKGVRPMLPTMYL